MNQQEIKKILDSEAGKAVKDYLQEELNKLRTLDEIKEKDSTIDQAIEVKAQIRAYKKLKSILDEIITIEGGEFKKPEKDRYDVGVD